MTSTRVGSALTISLLLSVGSMLPASLARADEPEPEVSSQEAAVEAETADLWDRLLAVELIGGIDTPFGVVGGAVVVTPFRHLALDLGGGVSRDGGRVAGGVRAILPHANGALGFRLGFAGGPLTWDTSVAGQPAVGGEPARTGVVQHREWDFVGFVDLSISLEARFDAGVYVRLVLGVEHALSGADRCVEDGGATGTCGSGGYQPMRSYLGLAVGYAFDL
jgi:hypothetical protein